MLIGYDFYTDFYGGSSLSEKNWERLSKKAQQRLKYYTFDRLPDDWEGELWEKQAKYAVCEIAECLFKQEQTQGKTSENTDGYSVSYLSDEAQKKAVYDIAYMYLGHTGLMSLGVDEPC